jgi:transcriptional regulator with XRE-family HTH domain
MNRDGKKRLGTRVRRARLDADLSQSQLARRLGVLQSVVSTVENGISTIDAPDLPHWAQALGKPILYFYLDETLDIQDRAIAIFSLFPADKVAMVLQMLQPLALSYQADAKSSMSADE